MNLEATKELLYKMADDQLILGHRNSEWTGIGPVLEEDIAFSSMAQDKLGHSLAFYRLLHELGEAEPDVLAFSRQAAAFRCCHLVELPIGAYDFSLIRHFLFDNAEAIRFELLSRSAFAPLAQVATKLKGELRYHVLHADTMIRQLGAATPESISRLQQSLDYALPYALGIFEPSRYEEELIRENIFAGEAALQEKWWEKVRLVLERTDLELPGPALLAPKLGGRQGQHTEHLHPLLAEMSEVINLDPTAEW
jgi:ring-1,2-phenylacetyl-CoA epoxidase subunit PaaC